MARNVCDPLDASTWPDGYICIERDGEFVIEKEADGADGKDTDDGSASSKTPWGSIFLGAAIGVAAGLFFSDPSNRKKFK